MDRYGISSRDYLARAEHQLAVGTTASLFYAAFELRCGVESRLQEYLAPHGHIPERRRADWRVGRLHRTTLDAFSLGNQIARIRIRERTSGRVVATLFYTPVSDRLRGLVEKFGNYLHAAKVFREPDDPFWTAFRAELEEATRLLAEATSGTLLGPMLREKGTRNAVMPVELPSGDDEVAARLRKLKGADLVLDIRYFSDLRAARLDPLREHD